MIIKGGLVFDAQKGFQSKDVFINGATIEQIADNINIQGDNVLDAAGCYVLPGFIDIHAHGACGCDTMQADYEALEGMSGYFASKGVTAFMPATMTAPATDIFKALENVREAIKKGTSGARILGVNLEGPFISPKNKGAHPEEHIINPSIELIESFIEKSGNNIRLMTIAPELDGVGEVIEHFRDRGIIFSAGHSTISYSEGMKAFDAGFTQVTHLFNAMTGIHHREPGLAGAAIDHKDVFAELICDGIHVNPAVIRMAVKSKTSCKVALITDSTMATGLEDGEYFLGGQKIIVRNREARLENGVLAGSTLTMIDGVKNLAKRFGIALEDAVRMATIAPARAVRVDKSKGSIDIGKDADIVIADRDLNIACTIREGRVVYSA